jgi:type VI secretion system secreted protein VgrG
VTIKSDYVRIESPAALKEMFYLTGFSGHEEMSRLFRFTLELHSPQQAIDPKNVIGQKITFSVGYEDQQGTAQRRYFNGYVSQLTAGGSESNYRQYQAEVVPWLWFLTRKSNCRIFSEKKIPAILQEVFDGCTFSPKYELKLSAGDYAQWEYCVQYRETDFNFVSRLMEQEGIFYYFEHSQDDHKLVLCDKAQHYHDSGKTIKYEYSFGGGTLPKPETITRWVHQYQYVSGAFAQTDYNFDKYPPQANQHPDSPLLKTKTAKGRPAEFPHAADHELFDYPAECEKVEDADVCTQRYVEEEAVACDTVSGTGVCEFFSPGVDFELDVDKNDEKNKIEKGKYTLLTVAHSASDPGGERGRQRYQSNFTCIPASVTFRPARISRKPAIHGAQTAVVVGPPGAEINTDKYGRVQVQFFWDRYSVRSQGQQQTPVWIRVGQLIAGKKWGAMFVPRVGQEVVVVFLEGDPDEPLITGVVYNADQMPPYPLDEGGIDENKTKSYLKTNSSPGGNGYNEIQFDDKAGHEMLYLHAQQNLEVRANNDSHARNYGNRHQIIGWEKDGKKGGSQYEMVYQDKQLLVHRDCVEQFGGNMTMSLGGIDGGEGNQDLYLLGTKKETIEKDANLHVFGDRCEDIIGDQSLMVGGSQQEVVRNKHALQAGQEIHLKSGGKVVIEAAMQLTLLGPGGGFVDIGPAGITVQGTMVNISGAMVMINSGPGGTPASGSGSHPDTPADADPAGPKLKPNTPEEAHQDKAKSGKKSTPY